MGTASGDAPERANGTSTFSAHEPYDHVIIGASPAGMFAAAELADTGARVLLIEGGERLGGAWESAHLEGWGEIETSCHLLEPFPGGYARLESLTGLPFDAMSPEPARVIHPRLFRRYHTRLRRALDVPRLIERYRCAGGGREKPAAPNGLTLARELIGTSPVIRYPRGGACRMNAALLDALGKRGVQLRTGFPVERVRRAGAWTEVVGPTRRSVLCRHVLLGGSVPMTYGQIDAGPPTPPHDASTASKRSCSLVLEVDREAIARDFSYVYFRKNRVIYRASTIGKYCQGSPRRRSHELILAQVGSSVPDDVDAQRAAVAGELVRNGLLRVGTEPALLRRFVHTRHRWAPIRVETGGGNEPLRTHVLPSEGDLMWFVFRVSRESVRGLDAFC